MLGKPLRTATALAGAYVALGLTYIIASGEWAAKAARDVHELESTETLKGALFVLATGVLLFAYSAWLFARVERASGALAREREQLLLSERRAMAGTLAAGVAHDFRNLLMTLRMEVEELGRTDISPEERLECLRGLDDALTAAEELTLHLADAAKGTRTASPRPIDLGALVRDSVRLLHGHPMVWACQVELVVEPVPILRSDKTIILQILTNLVLNAGEAVDGKGRIRVLVREDPVGVAFEVHDDGPGFGDGDVFAPFVTTRERGSGLGLLSVRSGVELLGGAVAAGTSTLGGAEVVVKLPLHLPTLPPTADGSLS